MVVSVLQSRVHGMIRNLTQIAAALLSGLLALAMLSPAHAGAQIAPSLSSAKASPALLRLAGYYSDGYGDDDGYRYKQKRHYDNYDNGDDGYDDYRPRKHYKHHYKPYKHYEHQGCGYKRWKRKYVCDEPSPRCFKQRECIWHYGREYCTYVKKCIGGEQYCHWKSVPVQSYCGDEY